MNLKQWQQSKKIKGEAEAAAKRTVERVLNTIKEPAMSEFKEFELKFDEWWEENYMNVSADRTEAFDIYSLGLKHQQAKVEELKASHHGEVIGHEVHFKKIKQERDELQTLYIQQGINMLKLQKRVDAALKKLDKRRDELWSKWKEQADMQDQGAANAFEEAYWILEQALKGEG